MEIDITHLMDRKADMKYYSASAAEIGQDAGRITWQDAMETFDEDNLDREAYLVESDQAGELRSYFGEFGAWDEDELDAMSLHELNALLLQLIAGDIREREHYVERDTLAEYEENIGGQICQCNDKWFYYVGN